MNKIIVVVFCFFSIVAVAQKKRSTSLGNITKEELKMTVYDKDSTASAVVLYEHANYYIDASNEYRLTTDHYYRIKILKKEAFDLATINVLLSGKENVHNIKAKTYNLSSSDRINEVFLTKDKVFTKKLNERLKEVSFTLSNIKVGSVIEYTYTVVSPYNGIDDWYFQSDIPKIRSDFTAAILGNYKYNIRVVGFLGLNRSDASVKKKCVYVSGRAGACLILDYGMDAIPAFKEENYMLSKRNYISKLSFELESFTSTDGVEKKFTKTWKDADKNLKYSFLDNQGSKKKYFKKNVLNEEILSTQNTLEKAKKVFELIKGNFNWNGRYWPTRKIKIKKAYEDKSGNIFDINLSLYNALQAAGIESKLTMLATRSKGLPTKLYPVVDEFNYLIVRVIINEKVYFLDATKKNLPFGLVQFEALNGDGRVMDFKKGSFWEGIHTSDKTTRNTKMVLNYTDEGLSGNLIINRTGYNALYQRDELTKLKEEVFLENFETKHPSIEVEDFKVRNLNKLDKKLQEFYKINIEHDVSNARRIKINPFFIDKTTENPFKLNERIFPVNYGYPRNNTYILSLKIPKEYTIKKLPEDKALALPNKGGRIIFKIKQSENTINLYLKVETKKKSYTNNEYFYLKEFYNQLIKIQDSFIEIEKI
jgi:hypothetical protein